MQVQSCLYRVCARALMHECPSYFHFSHHLCFFPSLFFFFSIPSAIPPPLVEISDSGGSRAGQILTLICSVTVVEGLVLPPHVEFVNASNGAVQHQTVQVGNSSTEGRVTTLTLQFSPLITSSGGEYTCRATIDIPQALIQNVSSESTIQVNVTSK